MKKLKKDPLRDFLLLESEQPVRPATYRVALQNGTLTSSYWDGDTFDIANVERWADRKRKIVGN